jgi:hypothetical protein
LEDHARVVDLQVDLLLAQQHDSLAVDRSDHAERLALVDAALLDRHADDAARQVVARAAVRRAGDPGDEAVGSHRPQFQVTQVHP